nr:photosystem II subunit L [Terminalia neotaliala]YP_010297122.1 photosystem II subunit L [Terminalia myriocarpa]QKJ81561.1 photosystem II subunit L [Terminalia neotaliala]UMI39182.1 photosystem II subunit L [Terminalia myriocarpa]
MNKMLN